MALIKPKTRKAITKPIRKLVKKHGPDVTIELVTHLVSTLNDDMDGKSTKKMRKKLKKANKHGSLLPEVASQVVSSLRPDMVLKSLGRNKKNHAQAPTELTDEA